MFTQNDFLILESIISKKDPSKGILKTNGTTKAEIIEITKLSLTKISATLYKLEMEGFIEPALKVGKAKSYIVTEKGFQELLSTGKVNAQFKGEI